ncbi:MAG: phosphotransferase [Pseudonocardiaceae bacterium]
MPTTTAPSGRLPVYSSGYALVLSSGLTSGVGFLFWIVATHRYSQDVVGVNSALVYAIMFLAGVAQLNLMNVLVRFVPVAGPRRRRLVVVSYLVGGGLATIVGLGFALGTRLWSPDLAGVLDDGWSVVAFAFACGGWAIFVMQDGVLTAVRRARVVPVENLFFSALKLGLVVGLAGILSTTGIAISWMAAAMVTVALTTGYLFTRVLRAPEVVAAADHAAEPIPLRGVARYVGGDYLGTLCWLACTQLLPVLVLAGTGTSATAAFAMAWTIAYTLYLVPAGMGQSLVAYASVDVATLEDAHRGVTRRALVLLVPVVALLFLAAPLVLRLLGPGYAESGSWALRWAALSALPNVITSTTVSVARVQRRMSVVVAILGSLSALVIVLSVILMPIMGNAGVGLALLAAQTVVGGGLLVLRAGWLPRPIVGPFAGLRHAGLLARVAPVALASLSEDGTRRWRVQGRLPGRSDTATGLIGPDQGTTALLKVAESASGRLELARQSAVLAAVHADDRLGAWRELVPRILGSGQSGASYYVVESRLPGHDGRGLLTDPAWRERFLVAAVATITDLHRRTAHPVLVDECVLDRWVRGPAARVGAVLPARHQLSLELLTDTVTTRLRGRRVAVGWRHGDYSPDNILLDAAARVTGVVDWGQAEREGLLVADVITLLLATESEAGGQELGQVVRGWLAAASPVAQATLTAVQRGLDGDHIDARTMVLFGWLQMVSGNLAKSSRYAANPVWMRRNVYAVLRDRGSLMG